MNTRRRFLAGAVAAAGAAMLPRTWAATDTHLLTATDVHVKDYPTVEAVRWIGETLERETDGRLKLRLYHSGQLGRESEAIEGCKCGRDRVLACEDHGVVRAASERLPPSSLSPAPRATP